MNESEYYAVEFSDDILDALAEVGEFYLDESGFYAMPTQEEMRNIFRQAQPEFDENVAKSRCWWSSKSRLYTMNPFELLTTTICG